MFVDVYHNGEQVARVRVDTQTYAYGCELAYIATQNRLGSWSQGPKFEDGEVNEDYNPDVEVTKELHRDSDGYLYGHRSSMVGDVFIANGRVFKCMSLGFVEVI